MFKKLFRVFFITALLLSIAVPVFAQDTTPVPTLPDLVNLLPMLVGFGALVAAVINVLKKFGVVSDGNAGVASLFLNLALLVVLVVAHVYNFDLSKFDSIAGGIAQVVTIVLMFLGQVGFAWASHKLLKATGVPVLGYSHSKG